MGKSVKKKNNVYAATKETEESRKDTFYDAVKLTVKACPKYIKTILGDVNSQARMQRDSGDISPPGPGLGGKRSTNKCAPPQRRPLSTKLVM